MSVGNAAGLSRIPSRLLAWSSLVAVLLASACSSGLEGPDAGDTTDIQEPARSTNLRFGFDPGFALSDPITDVDVCGGVIQSMDGSVERPIAFVAFVTATDVDDAEDGTTDDNGVEDVFIAAVDSGKIDPYAFTYSIAGTIRHPRCLTCHQMNVDASELPTPFLTQDHFQDGGGTPPLGKLDDDTCQGCHFEDWMAPGPTFDLRAEGTRTLFTRAQTPPRGTAEHFRHDPRVLWALDRGDTPFGGAADDDQDGVDEPEDHDGVRRHVPGGKESFLERLDGWLATADPDTGELAYSSAEDAVQDVVLVSRDAGGGVAADGSSGAPSILYVPNPGFDPDNPSLVKAGSLYLAFQSDGTDLIGGSMNAASDVFRATFDVFVEDDGDDVGFDEGDSIDLRYVAGSQILISVAHDGDEAKGSSRDPDIGADGNRIAFVSEANNLLAGFDLVCRPEVYLWDSGSGTALVSHVPSDPDQPGDAGATKPDLSQDGMAVCFESDATNLVAGDTNTGRDVFFALWPALDVQRASVTDAGGEFPSHSHSGTIHHSAGEVKVAFASQDGALPPVVAVACPDETVELTAPTKDTHVKQSSPMSAFPSDHLFVGMTGEPSERRSLVAFDVAGAVPDGSTIQSVTVTMEVNREAAEDPNHCPSGPADNTMELHAMNVDWLEDGATWNNVQNDEDPVVSSEFTVTMTGAVEWPSTPELVADVQGWLDAPETNFGWMVKGSTTSCSARRLDSDEQPDPGPRKPPKLTIGFTPPVSALQASAGSGASCVYLRDTSLARTFNLNEAVSPAGTLVAEELAIDGTALPASATNPVISPDGHAVLFESMAQNLDVVRPVDENRLMDVVLVDLLQLESQGFVLPYKLSVTADGGGADGPSRSPRIGAFTPATDAFPLGLALYATEARNLGDTDPGDLNDDGVPEADNFLLAFLSEGGSVLADFEARPARQGMGKSVAFASLSSGEPTTFLWDFGDGTPTSAEASPRHSYELPGKYSVTLSVSGERGSDDRTRVEYVDVLDAVAARFETTKDSSFSGAASQAGASAENTTPIVGAIDDTIPSARLLFDLDSEESTNFPDEFAWTLRRVDAGGAPLGKAVKVSDQADPQDVPIDAPGLYDLSLEATGPGGTGTATQRIEVYRKVNASFGSNPSGSSVRGPADLMVQFADTSSGDLLDANAHMWDFGDGSSSTETDPAHVFAPGVYFVRLEVAGKGTDSDESALLPVIADGTLTAVFDTSPRPAGSVSGLLSGEAIDEGSGVLVDFVNLSQHEAGSPLFFRWDFGSGALTGQEMLQDPTAVSYALSDPEDVQSFEITLVTSTNDPAPATCLGQPAGTCDERAGSLTLYPRPVVDFVPPGPSFPASASRPPHTVMLTGVVTGDGVGTDPSYRWLRSEPLPCGSSSPSGPSIELATELSTVVEFDDPGCYEVVLEVETNGPGGSRQVVRSARQGVVISASTLTEWYTQAVDKASGAKCTDCHKGTNPPAGLDWQLQTGEGVDVIFHRIVADESGMAVFSRNCDTSRRLIQPGEPENSTVYNVLLERSGPLCPINMRANLPPGEETRDGLVDMLRSWILDGAPDN